MGSNPFIVIDMIRGTLSMGRSRNEKSPLASKRGSVICKEYLIISKEL